jgi:hypothetical protein
MNDSDIDAQAIEIFSTDRIRCVATNEKITKRFEDLSEIKRTAFIEKIIDNPLYYYPTISGMFDAEMSCNPDIYFAWATEIMEVPGGSFFSIFKLLEFKSLDESFSQSEDGFSESESSELFD